MKLAGQSASVPVTVSGFSAPMHVDFIHDVAPVLSRLGCNQGTCHGSAQGKNGFKLSLRGYDPLFDVRALTDDHAARHINLASPDDSMMLTKPTGAVPHVGGALIQVGEPYYEILRAWISDGAKLDLSITTCYQVRSLPDRPSGPADWHQASASRCGDLRVMARSVTLPAKLSWKAPTGRSLLRAVPDLMTAIRRGEAPILARFEGSYASTTMTVMGDRSGLCLDRPPSFFQDRRIGGLQVEADEDPSVRSLLMTRISSAGFIWISRVCLLLPMMSGNFSGRQARHPHQAR